MLQLFLKTSNITDKDWSKVYGEIVKLAEAFPLRLMRIESYNGFERDQQDKDHLDLIVNRGQADEHLSFYGDYMSWTAGTSIRFYKNWSKHRELELGKANSNPKMPITWSPPTPFKDDGSVPETNGESTKYGYIDVRGALYKYAIIAIGILLETRFPGDAFLTAPDEDSYDIEQVHTWLEGHFGENFDLPIYFDKKRLLDSFLNYYDDPKHAVERLEHLYRKQFKRNITFALEHIGYEPTFRFYAEVLANCWFGTFGFSDVLNPWIAATQDLESTLSLVAESKRLRLERGDAEQARKYDLNQILEELLNDYILWSPRQREELERFYTNKTALETGGEDLWGSILRMAGHRVDICPIVATPGELFEAFMYHEPKSGRVFRKTIDDWLEKNSDAFERLMEKLANQNQHQTDSEDRSDDGNAETTFDDESILFEYPSHERFFIKKAILKNPAYFQLDKAVNDLCRWIWKTTGEGEHLGYVAQIRAESNADKKALVLRQLKEKRDIVTAGSDFENWLAAEEDPNVLLFLRLLLSLKIYDQARAYARYRILHDKTLWNLWRTGEKYAVR